MLKSNALHNPISAIEKSTNTRKQIYAWCELGKREENTEDESYQAYHQKSFLMSSLDFETLLITVFVLVDNWHEKQGKAFKGVSFLSKARNE